MDPSPVTLDIHTQKPTAKTGAENSQHAGHPQPLGQSPLPEHQEDAEFSPLSGKPYFLRVLKDTTNLGKMRVPRKVSKSFPAAVVPAKILYRGKVWDLLYYGNPTHTACRFENRVWAEFVKDNNLSIGDACVFELIKGGPDSDSIQIKVQILRDQFPSEVLEKLEGGNMDNPISID